MGGERVSSPQVGFHRFFLLRRIGCLPFLLYIESSRTILLLLPPRNNTVEHWVLHPTCTLPPPHLSIFGSSASSQLQLYLHVSPLQPIQNPPYRAAGCKEYINFDRLRTNSQWLRRRDRIAGLLIKAPLLLQPIPLPYILNEQTFAITFTRPHHNQPLSPPGSRSQLPTAWKMILVQIKREQSSQHRIYCQVTAISLQERDKSKQGNM